MTKIFLFLVVSAIGYGAYYKLVLSPVANQASIDIAASVSKKNSGSIFDAIIPSQETIARASGKKLNVTTNKAVIGVIGVTQYRGKGFPEHSAYMKFPYNKGNGLITVDNKYSGTHIMVEFKQNNKLVAAAYIKNGERFSAKQLPAGKLSLTIQDLSNSQVTTTRGFDTANAVKVTPYSSGGGSGSTAILLYRAEAQR